LRGQLEVLSNDVDATQKRQKDFYVDLDSRLRRLEAKAAEVPKPVAEEAPKVDAAAITREYEAALNLFKQSKYKDALGSFESFLKAHPGDALAPSAQYWIGNSHYALRDCKKAIDAQNVVIKQWPDSPKVPDAWLAIATCQQDLGDAKAARKSLDTIVAKYPDSPAAVKAKQRLKKK
jgi:tol-pal system protein YbgF